METYTVTPRIPRPVSGGKRGRSAGASKKMIGDIAVQTALYRVGERLQNDPVRTGNNRNSAGSGDDRWRLERP